MSLQFGDMIKEPASNKPTAGGTFNLSGTASSGFEKFDSQITSGNQVICSAKSSAGQMEFIGTYTNAATDTITVDALRHSSTGSLIDFSGGDTVVLENVLDASIANQLSKTFASSISGLKLTYSSTTALIIESGDIVINNKQYSAAQTTVTSASTMKDLAGSTVTLGASKAYFVYAYNNAGTLEFRIQERTGAGNGVDPTFSAADDYWTGPVSGSRRIGKFWTNVSSQIVEFLHVVAGRYRKFTLQRNNFVLLSNGASATYASAGTLTPFFTADDLEMALMVKPATTSSFTLGGAASVFLSLDGGTTDHTAYQFSYTGYNAAAATNLLGVAWYPYTGTLHYKATQANTQANIDACGFSEYV